MEKNINFYNYKITTDPDFMDELNAMTPELKNRMEELYLIAKSGRKKDIETFLNLIEKYPKNPQIKNYLTVLYQLLGMSDKAKEMNIWIVKEHPDYLFAKLNIAASYLEDEEFDKVESVLGADLELSALYPERKIFHLVEVISFLKFVVIYLSVKGEVALAENRFELLHELAPEHPDTELAYEYLMEAKFSRNIEKYSENLDGLISVHIEATKKTRKKKPPLFENQEIKDLYRCGIEISDSEINKLLGLERDLLIKDLETMLQDCLVRYDYFLNIEEIGRNNESMAIHAFYFLGELEAEESLNKILEFLSNDEYFLNFWFDFFLTEGLWEPLYKIGQNKLDELYEFMLKPGVYTYAKTIISDAVVQMYYHQPLRRNELANWFFRLLSEYNSMSLQDNVLDSELIGLLVSDCVELNLEITLPIIKQLFEKEWVDKMACGDFDEVEDAMGDFDEELKIEIKPLVIRYSAIQEEDEDEDYDDLDDFLDNENSEDPLGIFAKNMGNEPLIKVGRNDPCPCGSGLKYKKCCLNKN